MRIFTHVWYTLGLCVTFCVGNHIRAVGNELPPKFHSIFLNLRRHNGVIAKRKKKCWQHRNEMKRCDYIENRIMKSERDRKNCLFRIILWYICTLAAQEYRPSVTACLLRANIGQLYTKTNISLDIDAICQTSISHVMYETKSENAKKRERERGEREMQFDLKYRIIFNRQFSINHTKTVICLRFSFFFFISLNIYFALLFYLTSTAAVPICWLRKIMFLPTWFCFEFLPNPIFTVSKVKRQWRRRWQRRRLQILMRHRWDTNKPLRII